MSGDVQALLQDVKRLREAAGSTSVPWRVPILEACALIVETRQEASAMEVVRQLQAFGGEGWIETTDQVLVVARGAAPALDAGTLVLDAEVADGARSLHVRHDNGHWQLAWIEETAGATHLVRTQVMLGVLPGAARLRYRVYEKADGAGAMARLTGMES